MKRRIYVISWDIVFQVEQMLRNTGRIPDWDVCTVRRVPGGYKVEW